MPRYARLYYPEGVFHIISRCLNRQFLIEGPQDRGKYLQLIGSSLKRSDATVLAWCLMSSHIHLVVRAGNDPLEKLMKPLHTGYAIWKNKRVGRLGPVFSGRYISPLEEEEAYLLELIRYVHNNPVRAGVVSRPELSGWSSHRAYLGLERAPEWLNIGIVLDHFSKDSERARCAFEEFVAEGIAEVRRPEFSGGVVDRVRRSATANTGDSWRLSQPIIGSEEFAAKVVADLREREGAKLPEASPNRRRPELEELIAATCAVMNIEDWEFEQQSKRRGPSTARQIITWIWVQVFDGTQAQVSRTMKVYSSLVSTWYGKATQRLPELDQLISEILNSLPEDSILPTWKSSARVHYHMATDDEPDV